MSQEEKEKLIIKAIKNRNVLSFNYKGFNRIVEPFTLGIYSSNFKKTLSAFRIGGVTKSYNLPNWRVYSLDEISELKLEESKAENHREGYNKYDSRMYSIICTF